MVLFFVAMAVDRLKLRGRMLGTWQRWRHKETKP